MAGHCDSSERHVTEPQPFMALTVWMHSNLATSFTGVAPLVKARKG